MKKTIRAQKDELVDLYAKTEDGKWVLIFKQIPESTAETIWKAGFSTGQNNFSIENETGKRVRELNKKTLRASEDIDPEEAYENAEFYDSRRGMKRQLRASMSTVTLRVRFIPYWGDQVIHTAKISGSDLKDALMKMLNQLDVEETLDSVEQNDYDAEDIIEEIDYRNGVQCDRILSIKDARTGEVYFTEYDELEEEDWDR